MSLRQEHSGRIRRLGLSLAAALALAACAPEASDPSTSEQAPEATAFAITAGASPIVAAAHECLVTAAGQQPLPVDNRTKIGTLDNGLTYYVRHNPVPAGHLALRLVVRAGALADPPDAEGTAHFVEHMLFNGTEALPGNKLNQALRDIGMELGPDENAYTSYDSTVYFMSITTSGTEHLIDKVALPFEILSEWASAATILPGEVSAERGIVQNELDLRAGSADGHIRQVIEDLMFVGTPYAGRRVGGTQASLSAITPGQLLDFYDTWYVPENMAVIAVGDLPESDLQDLAERHFERLPASPSAPPTIPWSAPAKLTAQFARTLHADVGTPYVTVGWQTPAWRRGTACGERFRILDRLIQRMLTARLSRAHDAGVLSQANRPNIAVQDHTAKVRYYSAEIQGGDLASSAAEFWSVVRGTAAHPFTVDELDRAATGIHAELEHQAETATRQHDSSVAADLTDHFVRGADLRRPADQLAYATHVMDSTSVDELNDYHRWIMGNVAPVVVAAGAEGAELPPVSTLEAAIAAAGPVAPQPMEAAASAFMHSPEPVSPTSSLAVDIDAYGGRNVHEWTFPNGARVVFDNVGYGGEQVHVMIESLGGASLMDPADAAIAPYALDAVAASGLGDLSPFQVTELIEQFGVELSPYIEHTTEGFLGRANNSGLEAMFAYIHLLLTEPRVSESAARAAQQNALNAKANAASSAIAASQEAYAHARFGDNPYFESHPSADQIDAMTAERLLSLYRERFAGVDDLTVAIAGDVPHGDVEALAERYIGSLPTRPADAGIDRRPPFPRSVTRIEVPADTAAESGLDYYFELPGAADVRLVAIADVLTAVLNDRLLERVREELGQTYTVRALVVPQYKPDPWLWASISATGPGEALADIEAQIRSIVEQLSTSGPTESELNQAIGIVTNDAHFGGRLWRPYLLQMRRSVSDEDLPTASRIERAAANVTAADVRDLARSLFGSGQRIEIVRVSPPAG